MNLGEIRDKSDSELADELAKCIEALYNLRFRKVTDVIEDSSEVKRIRRTVARIKTVMRERQLKLKPKTRAKETHEAPAAQAKT